MIMWLCKWPMTWKPRKPDQKGHFDKWKTHTSLNAQKCFHAKGQLLYMNERLVLSSWLRHLYWVWAQSGRESSWFQRIGAGREVIFYFKDCTDGWISLLMRPLQAEQRKQMGALQPRVFCTVQTRLSSTNKGNAKAGDFFNQLFISVD